MATRPQRLPNPTVEAKQELGQVSQATVLAWLAQFRAFLVWCSEELEYTLPKHFRRITIIKPEAEEKIASTLTTDQIKDLWKTAKNPNSHNKANGDGERRRLWLLLGLNCGFYFVDCATLLHEHLQENGSTYIKRIRRKTRKVMNVPYRWKLWPETAALIKKFMAGPNQAMGGKSALFLDTGKALSTNNVRLSWVRLTDIPHSTLRDVGAQFVMDQGGEEVSEVYLAHSRAGVSENYTQPVWAKLNEATDAMYAELVKPAIDAAEQELKQAKVKAK
jgi:integrase